MKYPWDVVAVTCFVVIGVAVILAVLWRFGIFSTRCSLFSRKRKSSGNTPESGLPKTVQNALTQLEGVTEKRNMPVGEAADTECPICLGCLFANDQQQQPPQPQQTSSSKDAMEVDLEAGKDSVSRTTTTTTSSCSGNEEKRKKQPINDDVLKMKRCTHTFHSRCLLTWFMNKKYECPVCRTVYYQPPPPTPGRGDESDDESRYRREQDEYMYRHQLAYSIMPFF
ncbi:hypothetical protein F4810DRAFT_553001 [Camillea tinctor]|nr:hypothetical protein F4810DRAFT_553001 [Camillea tinctor]